MEQIWLSIVESSTRKGRYNIAHQRLCADSYLGIKEITSKKEKILHSETEHMMDNPIDIEVAKTSETPNVNVMQNLKKLRKKTLKLKGKVWYLQIALMLKISRAISNIHLETVNSLQEKAQNPTP